MMRETKSKILFRAVEEFERLRGSNLAWFGLDELTYTAEQAWLRLEGRLRDPKASRLCGFAVWTPKGYDWVYERFVARKIEGYETVMAEPFENRILLEQVPDYYERLRSSYDERFFQQEVLGEYVTLQRRARLLRVRAATATWRRRRWIERGLCCGRWILTSIRCARWWRRWMGTEVRVLDEIVLSRASTHAGVRGVRAQVSEAPAGLVDLRGCDRSAACRRRGRRDMAMLKQFFRSGEYGDVKFRIPPVESGGAGAGGADERASWLRPMASGALTVRRQCTELIKDLEQVTYKESSQVIDKERDPKRTHLSDALGYLVWQEFQGEGGNFVAESALDFDQGNGLNEATIRV